MQKQLEGNKMWTVVPTAYALLVNLDVFSIYYLGKKNVSCIFIIIAISLCMILTCIYVRI